MSKYQSMIIEGQIQLAKLKIKATVNETLKSFEMNMDIRIICIYYETEAKFTKQEKQINKNRFEPSKVESKKPLTINKSDFEQYADFGYMYFWTKTLYKMDLDVEKSIFHYKNLKPTLWIILFNPAIVILYLVMFIILFGMSLNLR